MLETWLRSETFTHGLFVLPAFIWLVYRERQALANCPHAPDRLPLILSLPVGLFWLVSHVAGILAGEQLALSLLLILVIWSAVGRKAAVMIASPLGFLLFLAPLGEELVPHLMELTAELTTFAIRLTGIPIYREGLFFSLPSGDWSVVEACSGIRYLIASMALGYLYAHFTYQSVYRKTAFMLLAIVVPLIANGIRAFGIVMIGHFSGMKLATGVDHLVYGWIFFGVVMFVLFSLGGLFRETNSTDTDENDGTPNQRQSETSTHTLFSFGGKQRLPFVTYSIALCACIVVWPVWAAAVTAKTEKVGRSQPIDSIAAKFSSLAPLSEDSSGSSTWRPIISGHDHFVGKRQNKTATQPAVDIMAYVFKTQSQGKEMINSMNRLVPSRDSPWRRIDQIQRTTNSPTIPKVQQSRLRSAEKSLLVWHWYQVGSLHTTSQIKAKLLETRDRLLFRSKPSIAWFVATDASTPKVDSHLRLVLDQAVKSD